MSVDDLVWCDECGRAHPWGKKGKRNPTMRRRLVECAMWPLRRVLRPFVIAIDTANRIEEALVRWADRPERERYEATRR